MESFTIDLVNIAPAQLFPDKRYISFTNFLPEQLKLEGQGEVAISAKGYPLLYQNVFRGKFMSFDSKVSKLLEFY